MPRVHSSVARRRSRKRVMRRAKGFVGGRSRLYRTAKETAMRAEAFAYRDRRTRKRNFRRLWIIRINAAARQRGLTYGALMNGLRRADCQIDRKVLADIAVSDPKAFDEIAALAAG